MSRAEGRSTIANHPDFGHASQPGKRAFADNSPPLAAWIIARHPDLVIHTGDVTVDGAAVEADLCYSAGLLNELGIR